MLSSALVISAVVGYLHKIKLVGKAARPGGGAYEAPPLAEDQLNLGGCWEIRGDIPDS